MSDITVAAFYKFVSLKDTLAQRLNLSQLGEEQGIKGTILLAPEGINGTVAGSRAAIDTLKAYFDQDIRFHELEYKESFATAMPFYRLKVRLKKEIVTLGVPSVDPTQQVGTYVNSEEWNQLLQDPDVIVIDTRNSYEVAIGSFQNALNPSTKSFRQFPDFVKDTLNPQVHKKIAMFCTGGIRCEKASSFMLQQGYKEVYHLKGGILKYLESTPPSENLWQGECFVFDQRTAVGNHLSLTDFTMCHACRYPLSEQDRQSPHFSPGVSCPHCFGTLSPQREKRMRERQRQCELANARGERHFGVQKSKA